MPPSYDMPLTDEQHEQCARALFNLVWTFLEKPRRSDEDTELMIHACHASCLHWSKVGTPLNFARGEWQLARVYAVAGRLEPALHHAGRCLELCERHDLGGFDHAFAHEALARAHAVAGDGERVARHVALAEAAAEGIADREDRNHLLAALATI